MKEALYILSDVVHALQEERGCSAILLYSKGALFAERVTEQGRISDSHIDLLQQGLAHWRQQQSLQSSQCEKLESLLKLCLELKVWRAGLSTGEVSIAECIGHYSHHLIGPLLQQMVELVLYGGDSSPTHASTYNAFLQWKERIGLERAIGARGFISDSFDNHEFLERVTFLLSEQTNYKNIFLALANEEQKQLVLQALSDCAACAKLHELHEALQQSSDKGFLSSLTPESWFNLISAKMNVLAKVEKLLLDSLLIKQSAKQEPPQFGFGDYDNLITSLPLFAKLTPANLGTLLHRGQVRHCKKGKLLFLQGEPASRLYIILQGWVKIFHGTTDGKEATLQMLSSGDAIIESAVFLNTPFPVSAQVIEDSVLLSLPAPIFRQRIKQDKDLAINLLAVLSHRSQGLIRQIQDTRLKSVDQRIGWFLLKLLLEQGWLSRHVKLPYDKSLIASYLGMKRETFSRSLKRMKEKGFKIENDMVIIPNLESLCNFCDADTANRCALHGTNDCPNPKCGEINPIC